MMYLATASKCPSAEQIELYSLDQVVEESELAPIEEHLLVCGVCQDGLVAADTYTNSMRAALAHFDVQPITVHAVHQTSEGSVYLWVSEGDLGFCIGRIQGCEVDSGHVVESLADGIRHNNMRFRALFPEHDCSAGCICRDITEAQRTPMLTSV